MLSFVVVVVVFTSAGNKNTETLLKLLVFPFSFFFSVNSFLKILNFLSQATSVIFVGDVVLQLPFVPQRLLLAP